MSSYDEARARLADAVGNLDFLRSAPASGEERDWVALWSATAEALLNWLDKGNLAAFDAAFPVVSGVLRACEARGRDAAMPRLFGDFTRRAIAASVDRTRFVDWFGPAELLIASDGRQRGRVLYFKNDKGHGRILAADRTVCFVHYSAIRGAGFRTLDDGKLVEFTPMYGVFNGATGVIARDVICVPETPQASS